MNMNILYEIQYNYIELLLYLSCLCVCVFPVCDLMPLVKASTNLTEHHWTPLVKEK